MTTAPKSAKTILGILCSALSCTGVAAYGAEDFDGERMIIQCFDYAARHALTPLSVAVVDSSGTLTAFRRQAGASPGTAEAALLKARTSARLNAPTALLGPVAAADASSRDTFIILQMTTIPGGVPFMGGNGQFLGAVGVSGAAPDQDAACAQRAIEQPGRSKTQ